jgi:microcystin-dependent protein
MEPYLGEIRIFGGNFAPAGWLFCQGQMLRISEYEALFTLVGTTYGGDGQTTFALPNLASRVVVGQGPLPGGSTYSLGQAMGTENVTLTAGQAPLHSHPFSGSVGVVDEGGTAKTNPTGNYFGPSGGNAYSAALGDNPGKLASAAVMGQANMAGGSQSHVNIQPVLATSYIICIAGNYPTQP